MTAEDLLRAVDTGLQSNFITARAAGRRMIEQGSGMTGSMENVTCGLVLR